MNDVSAEGRNMQEAMETHHKKPDIFLSHSGKQKGFVKDLEAKLSSWGYIVFFDQDDDSLPPGQRFPELILSAARACKLAVVVLSDDFLSSRWPMIELCAFAERIPALGNVSAQSFTMLPLFYELSPEDIKRREKVKEWRKKWKVFGQQDGRRGRMTVAKCEKAVTKLLPPVNGIVRKSRSVQGDASFIEEVATKIQRMLPRRMRFTDKGKRYSGRDRLCNFVLDKFRELEETHRSGSASEYCDACILGMFGVSGSGKSTICRFLCEAMFDAFAGNVIYLELPAKFDPHHSSADKMFLTKQYSELLTKFTGYRGPASISLYEVIDRLNHARFSHKTFLALDNISQSNVEAYKAMLHNIVSSSILRPGSRIMLVAQTRPVLENLLNTEFERYPQKIIESPYLTEAEAMEIMRNCSCPSQLEDDLMTRVLRMASFGSSLYIPSVFELIGVELRENLCRDAKEPDRQLEFLSSIVSEGKKDAVQKLVARNFEQLPKELQDLFMDIALFIIPAGYENLDDAIPILEPMHDTMDTFASVRRKINELCRHLTLSIIENRLRVHDIFIEYADSKNVGLISYVNMPWSRIPYDIDIPPSSGPTTANLKFLGSRTVNVGSCREWPYHSKDAAVDRDIHLDLHMEIGPKTKAVLVKKDADNSLKCVFSLSGDLSSLVCLETQNVQTAPIRPSGSGGDLSNLVKLALRNEGILKDQACSGQKRKRTSNSFLDLIGHPFQNCKQSLMWSRIPSMSPWQQPCRRASYKDVVHSLTTFGRMTRLRVLILINAGIRRLEDVGRYFPQLEDLEIHDEHGDLTLISIGSAPKLKRLATGGAFSHKRSREWPERINNRPEYTPAKSTKLVLQPGECPELQEVWMDVYSFDQVEVVDLLPTTLRHFGLAHHRSLEVLPTTLISPINRQLKRLEMVCNLQVKRLNFTSHYLPSLEMLYIEECTSLTHLSIHPNCMPNLSDLRVRHCYQLSTFEGLENLVKEQLQELRLSSLPHLHCDLRRASMQFRVMDACRCPDVKINRNLLESSENMVWVELQQTCIVSVVQKDQSDLSNALILMVNNLQNLRTLHLTRISLHHMNRDIKEGLRARDPNTIAATAATSKSGMLLCSDQPAGDQHSDDTQNNILRLRHTTALKIRDGQFRFLYRLTLEGCQLDHLQEIEGLQCLLKLAFLILIDLPSLTRVSGGWPPKIQRIHFGECPKLQEVPPLDHILNLRWLEFVECAQLKAVEGRFEYSYLLILFMGCKSMEVFPMERVIHELGQPGRSRVRFFRVCGSKFASVEKMRGWLSTAELWSPLFNAAVHGLMWEYMEKGAMDALDALKHYSSRLSVLLNTNVWITLMAVGSDLRTTMYSLCIPRTMCDFKEQEVSCFKEWIRNKFTKFYDLKEQEVSCFIEWKKPD